METLKEVGDNTFKDRICINIERVSEDTIEVKHRFSTTSIIQKLTIQINERIWEGVVKECSLDELELISRLSGLELSRRRDI